MRRHYIVVQLPTSAPVAELVPEMIAVAWGGVGNHDKYQGYKYEKYSREIIFR